jgi:hypothetical protein
MAQVSMASRKSLRVVPNLMLAQQTNRTRKPHLYSAIHQGVFEPLRALEAVVNQFPMIAKGMAE